MKGKQRLIFRLVLILIILGVAYWQRGRIPVGGGDGEKPAASSQGTAVLKKDPLGDSPKVKLVPSETEKVRGYDKLTGAVLVQHEDNDGDSFHVKAGGRQFELRLYFVDAPEKYLSDRYERQRERVEEQGQDLGGISPEQAVEVGNAAKMFSERELKGKTFTVYTYWEQVYDGDRYYGFVELADGSYLGTKLVESGLARIHTKGPGSRERPVPTPAGKSFHQHREMLYDLERKAKRGKVGAWSL